MENHEKKGAMHHLSPRRRIAEEEEESLFKEMIPENFPNKFRALNTQVYEAIGHVIMSTQSDLLQHVLY